MTRCKVRCTSVAKTLGWNTNTPFLYKAEFTAVTDGSPENKAFFEATPQGSISFSTVKADHFEVGKSYFVDFTEVQEGHHHDGINAPLVTP